MESWIPEVWGLIREVALQADTWITANKTPERVGNQVSYHHAYQRFADPAWFLERNEQGQMYTSIAATALSRIDT